MEIHLVLPTPPQWVDTILNHFDEFLADHADCERKASAMALRLVAKYPDRVAMLPPLIDLSIEELGHFREVYRLMEERGIKLLPRFNRDPYVNQLMTLLRPKPEERFLDHLLILGIVERRGAERFGLLADALRDPGLKAFYRKLHGAEVKHGNLFLRMARRYFSSLEVDPRLSALTEEEGKIIQSLAWRPSLH